MANRRFFQYGILITLGLAMAGVAQNPGEGSEWIERIDTQWGSERYKQQRRDVRGFPIPLGAMEKVGGSWRLKQSEPFSGELLRTTWQLTGMPITEFFDSLVGEISAEHTLAFACEARSCGNASEWASRVYGERLLYGRDDYMRYAAFKTSEGNWLTLFTAARTADRQYIHLDVALSE